MFMIIFLFTLTRKATDSMIMTIALMIFLPQVEKVVCETEFRPTCTVKLEKDCKNVTR